MLEALRLPTDSTLYIMSSPSLSDCPHTLNKPLTQGVMSAPACISDRSSSTTYNRTSCRNMPVAPLYSTAPIL